MESQVCGIMKSIHVGNPTCLGLRSLPREYQHSGRPSHQLACLLYYPPHTQRCCQRWDRRHSPRLHRQRVPRRYRRWCRHLVRLLHRLPFQRRCRRCPQHHRLRRLRSRLFCLLCRRHLYRPCLPYLPQFLRWHLPQFLRVCRRSRPLKCLPCFQHYCHRRSLQ